MLDKRAVNLYSPLALAFLGDSVYEQLVRKRLLICGNMPAGRLHSLSVRLVCAEFQSAACEIIAHVLDEEESGVLRRGRNATTAAVPKHSSVLEYRKATSLECLFGWLELLGRKERLDELFDMIWQEKGRLLICSDTKTAEET